jgi:hypothetical protein
MHIDRVHFHSIVCNVKALFEVQTYQWHITVHMLLAEIRLNTCACVRFKIHWQYTASHNTHKHNTAQQRTPTDDKWQNG